MSRKGKEVQIGTLIGVDAEIKGDFQAEGSARIDGSIQGNVILTGCLILGAGGRINGSVQAKSAILGGEVLGNIEAQDRVELTDSARIFGDISTNVIVIDENAVFQGRCDMNQEVPEGVTRHPSLRTIRAGRKSAKAVLAEALKEAAEDENRTGESEATAE